MNRLIMRTIRNTRGATHMETYIEKHFKMDFKPMANEGAVFQGACYRIAFLTSRIFV